MGGKSAEPRLLNRENAAAFCGLSLDEFDRKVSGGELARPIQVGMTIRWDRHFIHVRPRPAPKMPGYVYFIRAGEFVKIGYAGFVAGRMKELQTSNPLPLELLHKEPGNLVLEAKYHASFAALHVRGEWFRYEGEIRDYVEDMRRG